MCVCGWLGSRLVSVLDSGAEGPGFKSQSRRCRVTVLGKRASGRSRMRPYAGPATWNALPDHRHIRTVADPVKFRKLLKSHYFSQAFNIC